MRGACEGGGVIVAWEISQGRLVAFLALRKWRVIY